MATAIVADENAERINYIGFNQDSKWVIIFN